MTLRVRPCVWPECGWSLTHDESPDPDPGDVEQILREHMNEAHPGWTVVQVAEYATRHATMNVRRAFAIGAEEMFGFTENAV